MQYKKLIIILKIIDYLNRCVMRIVSKNNMDIYIIIRHSSLLSNHYILCVGEKVNSSWPAKVFLPSVYRNKITQ